MKNINCFIVIQKGSFNFPLWDYQDILENVKNFIGFTIKEVQIGMWEWPHRMGKNMSVACGCREFMQVLMGNPRCQGCSGL